MVQGGSPLLAYHGCPHRFCLLRCVNSIHLRKQKAAIFNNARAIRSGSTAVNQGCAAGHIFPLRVGKEEALRSAVASTAQTVQQQLSEEHRGFTGCLSIALFYTRIRLMHLRHDHGIRPAYAATRMRGTPMAAPIRYQPNKRMPNVQICWLAGLAWPGPHCCSSCWKQCAIMRCSLSGKPPVAHHGWGFADKETSLIQACSRGIVGVVESNQEPRYLEV